MSRQPVFEATRKRSRLYRCITILHAEKDGGVVLRGESSLRRTASGVMLNNRWGKIIIMFRHRYGS